MHALLIAALSASSFNPDDPGWSFWANVVTIAFAIIGPPTIVSLIANFFSKPRKQLSYQTESDAALTDQQKDLGEDMIVMLKGGALHEPTKVDNARLIMFKVTNTGADIIRKEDFDYDEKNKLRFEFAEAKLILCAIHHTEPDNLIPLESRQSIIHLDAPAGSMHPISRERRHTSPNHTSQSTGTQPLHRYVDLDGRTLDKGDAIILKFVTQGRVGMNIQGRLLGGKIVPYTPSPPIFTVPRVLVGLLIAFLIVLTINRFGAFQQNNCAVSLSSINIGGSTAFYATVQTEVSTYSKGCPFVTLNVQSSDSGAGLTQLENKNLDIADSEISPKEAGYNYSDLMEHQAAVIVFTMIINKDVTGITSLSQDQITKIYDGQYTNWNQVSGPNMSIMRFGRPTGSGTQAAFTRYVLQHPGNAAQTTLSSTPEVIHGVSSTPGAIGYTDLGSANQASDTVAAIDINGNAPTPGLVENDKYPFWAIERMYIRQNANNVLALSFITYITNNIRTNNTFINITDMPLAIRDTHE